MNKIDELLKNENVEWKKLVDVSRITKGQQFNKCDMPANGKFPVVNGGVTPSGYVDVYNCNENTITVSQGGSAGFVSFLEKKFWLGAHAYSVVPSESIVKKYQYNYNTFNRFLFHILKNQQCYLQNSRVGVGLQSIEKYVLENIQIPLISKNTQEKIVKILDNFTDYVTKLQAELQARVKQYDYYRELLLSEEYLNKLCAVRERERERVRLSLRTLAVFLNIFNHLNILLIPLNTTQVLKFLFWQQGKPSF